MTPPSKAANGAAPQKPSSEPGPQVLEELRAIDTSLLDKLIGIRAEQKRVETYRTKAADLKDTVKGPVWQQVMSDYTTRLAALEEQAAPLTTEVQREYQKLRALHERLTAGHEAARLAKEELEFREAVGELSKDDVKAKLEGPQSALDGYQRDLVVVESQKTKFVEAVGSEAALEPPAPPPPALAVPVPAPEPPIEPEIEPRVEAKPPQPKSEAKTDTKAPASPNAATIAPTTRAALDKAAKPPTVPEPGAPKIAPGSIVESEDATRVVSRSTISPMMAKAASAPAPTPAATPPASPNAAAGSDQRTFLLSNATVGVTFGDAKPTEHRLGPITYIGRTADNQIQIPRPGVSRRHALIEFTQNGFALKDLGSQNGTFLNGDPVTTQALTDGDRIVIGDAQIVFRVL